MTALARWWDECRVLAGETVRAWRSLLPLLLLLQVLSWFSFESSMALAAVLAPDQPWLSLVVFSIGFVMSLVVAVIMMRVVGDHLGSGSMVPDAAEDEDGRVGLTRMLALTMLPLLAIYAAFGKVAEAVSQLTLLSFAFYGSLGDNLLAMLSPQRAGVVTVLGALLGAYVLRRILDALHDRTGWRVLGILVTITEAFFVMGLVLAASRWISDGRFWLRNREFMAWWDAGVDGLSTAFAAIRIDLPAFLSWFGPIWVDHVFPALVQAITEPVIWLAVAALVFGSRVVSVAEMWRKGQPLVSQVPGARRLRLARRMAATAQARQQSGPSLGRRGVLWLQETLLGDIDDKYLPTLHAIRLVLKAGLPFLAAFLLVYNVVAVAKELLTALLLDVMGGHDILIWTGALPGVHLVTGLALETVRLALLAVAFHRCLQLFRSHAHPSDHPVPAPMPKHRVAAAAIDQWRKVRAAGLVLLLAGAVSTGGWVVANHLLDESNDYADGAINEPVPIGGMEAMVYQVDYGTVTGPREIYVTPGRWVVIHLRLSTNGPGESMMLELRGDSGRKYNSGSGMTPLGDSSWSAQRHMFEIHPDDVGRLELVVRPYSETVVRAPAARIDLRMSRDEADRARAESVWRVVEADLYSATGGN